MKKYSMVVLALLISVATFAQKDPSPQQIIDKYIQAIGGKAKLQGVKDLSWVSSASVQGMNVTVSRQNKSENKFKVVSTVDGMGEVNAIYMDGKKLVVKDNMQGVNKTIESGPEFEALKSQYGIFPELNFEKNKTKMTLIGKDTVNGKLAYKLEIAYTPENKSVVCYDVVSGLKVKETANTAVGSMIATFSDYKEVSGIKFPFVNTATNPMVGEIKFETKSVEINKGIPDEEFIAK